MLRTLLAIVLSAAVCVCALLTLSTGKAVRAGAVPGGKDTDWAVYGGNKAGQRYSPLTQINRGRAYFTSPYNLGEFILADYIRNRRRRVR